MLGRRGWKILLLYVGLCLAGGASLSIAMIGIKFSNIGTTSKDWDYCDPVEDHTGDIIVDEEISCNIRFGHTTALFALVAIGGATLLLAVISLFHAFVFAYRKIRERWRGPPVRVGAPRSPDAVPVNRIILTYVAVACLTGVVYAVWETTKNFQPGISVFARHLMWALSALAPAPLFYLGHFILRRRRGRHLEQRQ